MEGYPRHHHFMEYIPVLHELSCTFALLKLILLLSSQIAEAGTLVALKIGAMLNSE